MKKEAASLWKDMERYSKSFNRESHLGSTEYTTMKKELFQEIQAIQNPLRLCTTKKVLETTR